MDQIAHQSAQLDTATASLSDAVVSMREHFNRLTDTILLDVRNKVPPDIFAAGWEDMLSMDPYEQDLNAICHPSQIELSSRLRTLRAVYELGLDNNRILRDMVSNTTLATHPAYAMLCCIISTILQERFLIMRDIFRQSKKYYHAYLKHPIPEVDPHVIQTLGILMEEIHADIRILDDLWYTWSKPYEELWKLKNETEILRISLWYRTADSRKHVHDLTQNIASGEQRVYELMGMLDGMPTQNKKNVWNQNDKRLIERVADARAALSAERDHIDDAATKTYLTNIIERADQVYGQLLHIEMNEQLALYGKQLQYYFQYGEIVPDKLLPSLMQLQERIEQYIENLSEQYRQTDTGNKKTLGMRSTMIRGYKNSLAHVQALIMLYQRIDGTLQDTPIHTGVTYLAQLARSKSDFLSQEWRGNKGEDKDADEATAQTKNASTEKPKDIEISVETMKAKMDEYFQVLDTAIRYFQTENEGEIGQILEHVKTWVHLIHELSQYFRGIKAQKYQSLFTQEEQRFKTTSRIFYREIIEALVITIDAIISQHTEREPVHAKQHLILGIDDLMLLAELCMDSIKHVRKQKHLRGCMSEDKLAIADRHIEENYKILCKKIGHSIDFADETLAYVRKGIEITSRIVIDAYDGKLFEDEPFPADTANALREASNSGYGLNIHATKNAPSKPKKPQESTVLPENQNPFQSNRPKRSQRDGLLEGCSVFSRDQLNHKQYETFLATCETKNGSAPEYTKEYDAREEMLDAQPTTDRTYVAPQTRRPQEILEDRDMRYKDELSEINALIGHLMDTVCSLEDALHANHTRKGIRNLTKKRTDQLESSIQSYKNELLKQEIQITYLSNIATLSMTETYLVECDRDDITPLPSYARDIQICIDEILNMKENLSPNDDAVFRHHVQQLYDQAIALGKYFNRLYPEYDPSTSVRWRFSRHFINNPPAYPADAPDDDDIDSEEEPNDSTGESPVTVH